MEFSITIGNSNSNQLKTQTLNLSYRCDNADWLEPMAATLTQDRFAGGEWLFERKFDGIRLLAYKRGRDVQLYSRNRLPQNLPGIAEAIAAIARRRRRSSTAKWRGTATAAITCSTSCGSNGEQHDDAAARRTPRAAEEPEVQRRRCGASICSTMRNRGSGRAAKAGKA